MVVALLAALVSPWTANAAAADWTKAGPAHTLSVTDHGADVLLNYNNDGYGRFSVTATYTTVATATGTDTVAFSWSGCHSWHAARGSLTFFADGPSGRSSQTVYNNYFNCGGTVTGAPTLNLTKGYPWGVTVTGSHYDSSYILRGQVRLVTDTDGDGVDDVGDAFPDDANETTDTDGDGVGDNGDAFPSDATETTDTDADGVGGNTDNCPDVANAVQVDADGDGGGDICDAYPTYRDGPQEVIDELTALLPTGDQLDDRRIALAIANLEKLMQRRYWTADGAALSRSGRDVLDRTGLAVKQLEQVGGVDVTTQVDALVELGHALAPNAISQAEAVRRQALQDGAGDRARPGAGGQTAIRRAATDGRRHLVS